MCLALWFVLYYITTSGHHSPSSRVRSFLLLVWTGWISFIGGTILQDDLSHPFILLVGCAAGFVLANALKNIGHKTIIVLLVILSLLVVSGCLDFFWRNWSAGHRVRWRGPWINSNTFGAICAISVFWGFFLLDKHRVSIRKARTRQICPQRRILWWLAVLAAVCCALGVLGSKSRTATWGMIALLLAHACLVLFSGRFRRAPIMTWAGPLLFVGSYVAYSYFWPDEKTMARISTLPSTHDLSILHRWRCWKATIDLSLDHPLTGWGWDFLDVLKQREAAIGVTDVRAAMLNNFTQTFATRGIFGLLGLCTVIGCLAYSVGRRIRRQDTAMPLGMAAGFLFMHMVMNDVIYSMALGPVFWLLYFLAEQQKDDVRTPLP